MKKLISFFMAATMMLSLAACGNGVSQADTQGESSVTSVSSETSVTTSSEEVKNEDNKNETSADTTETSVSKAEETEPEEEALPEAYLSEIYATHGLKVGTCLSPNMLNNSVNVKIIKEQFNSVTLENDMKPEAIINKTESVAAGNIVVSFNSNAKKMLDFAKENNMAVRGHTLVWHSQTPQWIFYEDFDTKKELVSREVMLDRMETYIKGVFELISESGYEDMIYAYDVVNEAWMEDGSMRDSLWKQTIGDDYLWYAFYFADKYAPESIDLYYNDYNEQYKVSTLTKFVETLKDDDGRYLIDGIGLQAHLYTQDNLKSYLKAVEDIGKTGLKVQLTELDVCLGAYQQPQKNTDTNLKNQGQWYYELIEGIFEMVDNGTITSDALTFWGYADSLSWRSTQYPLLYDGQKKPKYSYYGAAQMKEYAGY